jgi:FPC/CPF motif-containing protein YcgG
MTFLYPTRTFSYGVNSPTLPPLHRALLRARGNIKYTAFGSPEVTSPLHEIANAVESAFVLVEKATLPKITHTPRTAAKRQFYFAGDPFVPYSTDPNHTAEQARNTAAKWLAIAGHLEAEEKAAAEEAKKQAAAKAEASRARRVRLTELAEEHFEEYFEDLGPKKQRVIEEIYRLEQELNQKDAA